MGFPINRVPPGLLSLLDVKTGGQNPVDLHDSLTATLELSGFYFAAVSQFIQGTTAAINTVGNNAPTAAGNNWRPDPGQFWVINWLAVRPNGALGAGTTYKFRPCIYQLNTGSILWAGDLSTGTATELPVSAADRVLYVTPGYGVGVYVDGLTLGVAAAFLVEGSVSILRY